MKLNLLKNTLIKPINIAYKGCFIKKNQTTKSMAQTRLESEPLLGKIALVRLKFLLALSAYFFTPAESKLSSLFVWTVVS